MPLQYLQDFNGVTTAVAIPIEDWNRMTEKYSDIEELPQWQKDILDTRLIAIEQNPEALQPIDGLFDELDKDEA